jgi:hypothetical protein
MSVQNINKSYLFALCGSSSSTQSNKSLPDNTGKNAFISEKKPETTYRCSDNRCQNVGNFGDGSIKQFSVGPEKDCVTLRFCSEYCWNSFRKHDMFLYSENIIKRTKYSAVYPPSFYPSIYKRSCEKWLKNGLMLEHYQNNCDAMRTNKTSNKRNNNNNNNNSEEDDDNYEEDAQYTEFFHTENKWLLVK